MNSKTKELAWREMSQRLTTVTDKLGMPIDKPIFDMVVVLNLLGFQTTGSCGGHVRRTTGGPYVVFESKKAQNYAERARAFQGSHTDRQYVTLRRKANYHSALEIQKMLNLLEGFYKDRVTEYPNFLTVQSMPMTYNCLKCINAETALALSNQEKKILVERHRAEVNDFTDYLRMVYLKSNDK